MISRHYSIEQCRVNSSHLFIFGDNVERSGMGGTACIREQKNAIGIATKYSPSSASLAYFSDDEYENNCKIIEEDIEKIKKYAEEIEAKAYVFPHGGIGNGLALLPVKAPLTYCYLTKRLIEEFQYNNLAGVFNK